MPAALLPPGTRINTNGAGDSFTAGLLISTMLRHTGISTPATKEPPSSPSRSKPMPVENEVTPTQSSSSKKVTPYTLYMKEKYVTLKGQYKDDKKKIFTICHSMWENESYEIKSMYDRMAREENEEAGVGGIDVADAEAFDPSEAMSVTSATARDYIVSSTSSGDLTNKSLSLEAAVQFAGLVAARHVNVGTRDLEYLDINTLLGETMIFSDNRQ